MTSMLPAIIGALVGGALYVAFDFYVLGQKRRATASSRR